RHLDRAGERDILELFAGAVVVVRAVARTGVQLTDKIINVRGALVNLDARWVRLVAWLLDHKTGGTADNGGGGVDGARPARLAPRAKPRRLAARLTVAVAQLDGGDDQNAVRLQYRHQDLLRVRPNGVRQSRGVAPDDMVNRQTTLARAAAHPARAATHPGGWAKG